MPEMRRMLAGNIKAWTWYYNRSQTLQDDVRAPHPELKGLFSRDIGISMD